MTKVAKVTNLVRFDELSPPLRPDILAAIKESFGFEQTTPVQAATIPLFINHKDVSVEACTGSGKTLAYLVPIIEILLRCDPPLGKNDIGAVVIAPTRELAHQIHEVACKLLQCLSLVPLLLVGGADTALDRSNFQTHGGNILIGTPGRLEDLLCRQSSSYSSSKMEVLVLDEADRLLDMGFAASINSILNKVPKQRRTGLFSATQTEEVKQLVRAGLRNPVHVAVKVELRKHADQAAAPTQQKTPLSLANFFVAVSPAAKLSQLVHFLNAHSDRKVMVYALTCALVDYLHLVLTRLQLLGDIPLLALHGKMVQKKRTGVYSKFIAGSSGVLLCTDVAARGLDIPDVDMVVQFDAPQDPNAFVHRVGRTARMGRSGTSLVYLMPEEEAYIEFLRGRNIPVHEQPPYPEVEDVSSKIHSLAVQERDVFEKGQVAFVSYIRAYKEHECQFIFRFATLDLGGVAVALGLPHLPKMPELRNRKIDFKPAAVRPDDITFTDPVKEEKRKVALVQRRAEWEESAKDREKWKRQREKEIEKVEKDLEKKRKKKKQHATQSEWDELSFEARMMKKLKKGAMSQQEFDRVLGEDLMGTGTTPAANVKADSDSDVGDVDSGSEAVEGEMPKKKMKGAPKTVKPIHEIVKRRRLAKIRAKREERTKKRKVK